MAKSPRIAVVGAGLAGSLLALALARRGESPLLLDGGGGSGSAHRGDGLQLRRRGGLGPAAPLEPAGAPAWGAGLAAEPPGAPRPTLAPWTGCPFRPWPCSATPLPFGRVDPRALGAALPRALAAAGVERCTPSRWRGPGGRWRAWWLETEAGRRQRAGLPEPGGGIGRHPR